MKYKKALCYSTQYITRIGNRPAGCFLRAGTSGFHASFIPEKGTVKDWATHIKSPSSLTPEDVYSLAGDIRNPFAQDVYLLAIIAHKICFPEHKMKEDEGLAIWTPIHNDPFADKLNDFFAKAMNLVSQNRFTNAAEMLAEFNAVSLGSDKQYNDTHAVIQELNEGEFIKRNMSPFQLLSHFPPISGEMPSLHGDKIVYRCLVDDEVSLIKFWPKAGIDLKNPGANRRLLRMRHRIEKAIEISLPIANVKQYGLFGEGAGLFILTRFEEGVTWSEHVKSLSTNEDKLHSALVLCDLIIHLHSSEFSHGDLHPENILVCSRTNQSEIEVKHHSQMLLIDTLDYGDTSDPYNIEYGPANPASSDGFGRDKFAVYRMVKELFGEVIPKKLQNEIHAASEQPDSIPVDLILLRNSLKAEIELLSSSQKAERLPLRLIYPNIKQHEKNSLLQEEGLEYHMNVSISNLNKEELYCVITAHYSKLTVILNPEFRKITKAWIQDTGLSEYAQAAQRAQHSFTTPISIENGQMEAGKPNSFIEFMMDQNDVLDLLEEILGIKDVDKVENEVPLEKVGQTIRPHQIWQTLMDTEEEERLKVEIRSTEIEESKSGAWLIPCILNVGNELEFSLDDEGLF